MTTIDRSALVQYSPEQMFDLVNDIEKYPEYMQGCRSAEVLSRDDNELVGRLCLAKAGIRQEFTTRNLLRRPHAIDMELVEGRFSHFSARWRFESLSTGGCRVSLHMAFGFNAGLVNLAVEKLLGSTANSMVDSLVVRARQVYG